MSSKFLDKTGLDTLWAKIKSTFQTLGNLVTAWGSTPSDTKYPSEKLVKDSLDAISTNGRTIPQDVSKGANLVVNGSGRMSSNYNFSGFTYLPTICYNGSAGSFGFNGTQGNNEFISCDFNKKIVFSADIRNLVAQPSNCVHRIYVSEYDIDKKSVNAIHVMYGVGTLTELTQDLNPGDTVVHLADLSNANWLSSTSYHRGFIFWNYQNSYGYLYPPETYSRNVYPSGDSNPLWDVANVNVSAGTITLNSGWTGPAIPAGTKVSRRSNGNTYPYPATITTGDTEWHSLKGYVKGIVAPGTSERVSTKFSQGTAFIKVGMYTSNLTNTDPVTGKRAAVTNFFVYEEQDINDGFGTLPVNRGGTGKTSVTAGNYLVGNGTSALTEKTPKQVGNNVLPALNEGIDNVVGTDYIIASNHASGVTDATAFVRRTADKLWNYIKNQISSVLGLTATSYVGNAATATALSTGSDRTKLDGIEEGAEVNVQSDWNQTDTSADDYIKNKPKTVLWLTYGSTYTKAQVDGWIADGYLLCVSYNSRTYKLGRATSYQDTNYYTFSDELDYVRLTIDNSTSAWTDGTNYPTAASIGAAPSVHTHGNIASDGTDGQSPHDTSRYLRGDGAWARLQLRATLKSDANGYFRITCTAGSDCEHSSVYVFGSYNEYGYLYQVSFNYKNNQFNAAPRVRMITCNNETGLNYIPKAIKYGTGAAGTGYIFIQTSVVQRCTFLVTGNSPSSITIDTVTSTDSATSVSDGAKGHGSVHTDEYGTGTGSSTQPVFISTAGKVEACKYTFSVVNSITTSNMVTNTLYFM